MFKIIVWYIQNIWEYVYQMLPGMLVTGVVWGCIRPWQRSRLTARGLVSTPEREGALLLFALFCTGLGMLTLFPHGLWRVLLTQPHPWDAIRRLYPSWEEIQSHLTLIPDNWYPFQEIRRILWGGEWIWFVLWGNIGMFMPVGFFVALLWRKARWYRSVAVGFLASLLIEFVQLFIGRVSDIDDVILNTTGALLGYGVYWLFYKLFPRAAVRFQVSEQGEDT